MNNEGRIIIVVALPGTGKGTVIRQLLNLYNNYDIALTTTSRKPRENEVSGTHYYFVSEEEFKQGIQNEEFFEFSGYCGNYYGTLKSTVYSIIHQHKNAIIEIDMINAFQIKQRFPEVKLTFIIPPDLNTALKRLNKRLDDRHNNADRLNAYLTNYAKETYSMLRGDILIVNADPIIAAHQLAECIENPIVAAAVYEENVDKVVSLKKEIHQYLYSPNTIDIEIIYNKLLNMENQIDRILKTEEDTNKKVTKLMNFAQKDLQDWIIQKRPRIDNEELIAEFARQTTIFINGYIQQSLVESAHQEEQFIKRLFGDTWERLLPTTKSSLISAWMLWKMCSDIAISNFDYSGVIITATSALESELKKVFYIDFQHYMIKKYGNPNAQSPEDIFNTWPDQLLNISQMEYMKDRSRSGSPLEIGDRFTMGFLPFLFYDKNSTKEKNKLLQKRMKEYLQTIVKDNHYGAPLKAFNNYSDPNNFVKQCEYIRKKYRNPAGHVSTMSRNSAEECLTKVIGKVDAYRFVFEINGLIMKLYGLLK